MPKYDLLIAGGTVLDPANSLETVADVAISDGLVDRVEPEIDRSLAAEVVDAAGLWVMPGMVDGHVHVGGERSTWDPALGYPHACARRSYHRHRLSAARPKPCSTACNVSAPASTSAASWS